MGPSLATTVGMLLLVALGAHDLQRNMYLWSVGNIANYYPPVEFLSERYFPVNRWDDTPYLVLLTVGLVVSLVSSALLLFLAGGNGAIHQQLITDCRLFDGSKAEMG